MADGTATIFTDGASRGNPGAAAWAFVLTRPGAEVVEVAAKLGTTTNNVAEYTALVRALEHAGRLGIRRIDLFSDSELLVKQMNGEYAVKSVELRDLYDEAQRLRRGFDGVRIAHVRRAQNKRADELCNAALDGRSAASPKTDARPRTSVPVRSAAVDEQAVACLRAAAEAWSRGGVTSLAPEQLWEQLWTVLEDGGVLKKAKAK